MSHVKKMRHYHKTQKMKTTKKCIIWAIENLKKIMAIGKKKGIRDEKTIKSKNTMNEVYK